jgi:hypothetical protein
MRDKIQHIFQRKDLSTADVMTFGDLVHLLSKGTATSFNRSPSPNIAIKVPPRAPTPAPYCRHPYG